MQITHGEFEIYLGLPLMGIDGKCMVAWALYRIPRTMGDQPEYLGATIGVSGENLAVATALAESRVKANELA
ncbi:MAG: hypothetical protein GAK28_02926 [Luteibacter sp.]|uniref:hypothetical protein n=1 Tax=Luteibacter sp. TaxID=1886636 RepID=UPI00137DF675|nr:hypothetical protein [Luteibacter sp.]KAF1006018.1 MAG: hypothetical protein GAK28_02926 [Luteibacter sp.]